MIDIVYDEMLGILRCVSRGPCSLDDVDVFGRKALPLLERARARRGHALYLVDAAQTAVHSKEVAARLADLAAGRMRPGDRNAIVIGSAIAKLQSARMTTRDDTAYFDNEALALAWLLSDAPAR